MARRINVLLCGVTARYTHFMTMIDLGPERPGHPSETRQMGEAGRAAPTSHVRGRWFWLSFVIIAAVLAAIWFVKR